MATNKVSGWEGLPAKIRQAAARGVLAATEEVRNEALSLIDNSPATGRVYRRNGVEHTASSPGNAPRSDTGELRRQITTEYADDGLTGYVNSAAEYARAMEYGTTPIGGHIEPRPYMRPALQNKSKEIESIIRTEIEKALK